MGDQIKYSVGATGLAGSLGGESESILATGFTNETQPKAEPWDFNPSGTREDENGNTSVGDPWNFRKTGAAGRPRGDER